MAEKRKRVTPTTMMSQGGPYEVAPPSDADGASMSIPYVAGRGLRKFADLNVEGLRTMGRVASGAIGGVTRAGSEIARGVRGEPTRIAKPFTPPDAGPEIVAGTGLPMTGGIPLPKQRTPVASPFAMSMTMPELEAPAAADVPAPAAPVPVGPRIETAPEVVRRTSGVEIDPAQLAAQQRAGTFDKGYEAMQKFRAGRDASMAMTSPAALRMSIQMAGERARAARNQMGGRRYAPEGVEAQRLQAQWEDAARASFLGAMTPEQRQRYEAEESRQAVERFKLYEQTPEAFERRETRRSGEQVARYGAEGAILEREEKAKTAQEDRAMRRLNEIDNLMLKYEQDQTAIPERLLNERARLEKTLYGDAVAGEAAPAQPEKTTGQQAVKTPLQMKIEAAEKWLSDNPKNPQAPAVLRKLNALKSRMK